ncbi:hypothetical protein HYX12_04170 [Candidatus Woesearchaeota archaeon]|nr:hypothetical protein [Candidatus Woesearchaeota archaeon]
MSQHHDTLREELGEILDKLQEIYRRAHPNTALLFSTGDASFTAQDVAKTTSLLAPREGGAKTIDYSVYAHNIPAGNQQVGELHTEARMGKIDVGYVDRTSQEKKLRFKIDVGFGSRVINYSVLGSDGQTWHSSHSKPTVIAALEQVLQ